VSSDISLCVSKLTEADLLRHPLWQFVGDDDGENGGDESHVSPVLELSLAEVTGSFIAYATYKLKNGQDIPGAVQVDVVRSKAYFTPAFIYVGSKALDPLEANITSRIARLTKSTDTQPVKWTLAAILKGETSPRTGRISQFLFIKAIVLVARLIALRLARRSR